MAPWLQSGWSPISPEALTLGLGLRGRTQMTPVLGSARAPLDLVPELPHEILVRNNGRR